MSADEVHAPPGAPVTLGVLYHMPFWQTADGVVWEAEGSLARYVDSLAPYFDRVLVAAPVFDTPPPSGSRVRSANVRLLPLPYFPGPRQFYPKLPSIYSRLRDWVDRSDIVHLRVPTPAGIFAFRLAQARQKPVVLLVVGDYEALLPHLPYRGVKKTLFSTYVAFEERVLRRMTRRALTFANGAALREKHERQGATVFETTTTTIRLQDIASRADTCETKPVKLLTVSRIDPRKGLRVLPEMVATLVAEGHDITLDLVGPTIGLIGDEERDHIVAEAVRHGVAERLRLRGAVPLDDLMPLYARYDVFVFPTQPGEGIPRVLLEAMAAGLPVVTTNVSGIGSLVRHGENGLLAADGSARASAEAVRTLLADADRRRRLIAGGYETARRHTLEHQAAEMMQVVADRLHVPLASPKLARQGRASEGRA